LNDSTSSQRVAQPQAQLPAQSAQPQPTPHSQADPHVQLVAHEQEDVQAQLLAVVQVVLASLVTVLMEHLVFGLPACYRRRVPRS
jgi:hypothetical protein